MITIRNTLFTSFISMFCVLSSGSAKAVVHNWTFQTVVSGGVVHWEGTKITTDKLLINNGSATIWNDTTQALVQVPIAGAHVVTKPAAGIVFDDDDVAQAASKVYYVYWAGYPILNPTNYAIVASSKAPCPENDPCTGLKFTVGGIQYTPDLAATFLGSFTTDSAGEVVPFQRNGDEVLIAGPESGPTPYSSASVSFANADGPYPVLKAAQVVANAMVPTSADGLIVDMKVVSTAVAGADLYLLADNLNQILGGGLCKLNAQVQLFVPGNSTASAKHMRVTTNSILGNGNITFGACVDPLVGVHSYAVTGSYVGYIETPNHNGMH